MSSWVSNCNKLSGDEFVVGDEFEFSPEPYGKDQPIKELNINDTIVFKFPNLPLVQSTVMEIDIDGPNTALIKINRRDLVVERADKEEVTPSDNIPTIKYFVKTIRPSVLREIEERNRLSEIQFRQGNSQLHGSGVEKNITEAILSFQKAANNGNAKAQFELGYSYEYGRGVDKDINLAIHWYQKAANQGDTNGAKQDVLRLMSQKAKEGDASAQYWLATQLSGTKAVNWFRKSADQGNVDAQYELGKIYICGKGVDKDEAQAVSCFKKAAEQGLRDAQYEYGKAYANGSGVPVDFGKVVHWHKKAAKEGCERSQYSIGCLYENGDGVPKDIFEAAFWWWKASTGEDYENSGKSYEENVLSIKKLNDLYQSKIWKNSSDPRKLEMGEAPPDGNHIIERALDGYPENVYLCGKVYEMGAGVPQNLLEAASWWRIGPLNHNPNNEYEDYSETISALDSLYASDKWKSISTSEKEKIDQHFVEREELGFFDICDEPKKYSMQNGQLSNLSMRSNKPIHKYFQKSYLVKMAEDLLLFFNNEINSPRLNFQVPPNINLDNADEYKAYLQEFLDYWRTPAWTVPSGGGENVCDGYVYVLTNSAFPNLLKIGQTTREPHERATELSTSTGVPYPFVLAYYEKVDDPEAAEKEVHAKLDKYRSSNNREFFEVDIMEAQKVISEISKKYRS